MKLKKVHQDKRGEIYTLVVDGPDKEITFLFTKKDFARGGCVHRFNNEYVTVLRGKVRYTVEYAKHKQRNIFREGESFVILKESPHWFVSLTDSLVMEWGATLKEKNEKYKPFRDIVDKINEKKNTSN